VDVSDEYQLTPLHMAAKYGVVDTARELLDHGADKDKRTKDTTGRGVLHYAHSPDMIRYSPLWDTSLNPFKVRESPKALVFLRQYISFIIQTTISLVTT
jgi:hypothetical protein